MSLFLSALTIGCGAIDWNEPTDMCEDHPEQCEEKQQPVVFEGYIQRAFDIRVNSVEFLDSEDFYSRFIDELVLQERWQQSLVLATIEVEGEYGVDTFGSHAKAFLVSESENGSAFEATANRDAKFKIKIPGEAVGDTYKLRVLWRIGLRIETEEEVFHYCYQLHGRKSGIEITEENKSVIVDQFETQLTKYKCDDAERKVVELPDFEEE